MEANLFTMQNMEIKFQFVPRDVDLMGALEGWEGYWGSIYGLASSIEILA
jgi:hypothetical protein